MRKTLRINKLEQVRLLADPLKLQLLQTFAEGEKTAKQAAEELGERLTKLYRHVDALLESGLIEITRETPKRGTVERTFRAVAQRFEVEHSLFAEDGEPEGIHSVRELLRSGEDEVIQALDAMAGEENPDLTVVRFRVKASRAQIARLHRSLKDWIASVQDQQECAAENCGDNPEEAGAMIAFYPIVKGD